MSCTEADSASRKVSRVGFCHSSGRAVNGSRPSQSDFAARLRFLGLPGGSSCIHTKIAFVPCGSTSSWASASPDHPAAGVSEEERAQDLAPRVRAATRPARRPRKAPEVFPGAEGARRRARSVHRSDDQVAGLSLKGIAVRLASRASSAGVGARRWSSPGVRAPKAKQSAVCRLVHACGQHAGSGRGGRRVSGLLVQAEESSARPRRIRIHEAHARRPGKL